MAKLKLSYIFFCLRLLALFNIEVIDVVDLRSRGKPDEGLYMKR